MNRYITTILLAIAIMANLLIPQQMVRYRPCCYDANGNLARHLCRCSCNDADDSGGKVSRIGMRSTCCDPIVTHFTANLNAPVVTAAALVKYDSHSDFIAEMPQVQALELSVAETHVVVWDTGPPRTVDVLTLHSRLNL